MCLTFLGTKCTLFEQNNEFMSNEIKYSLQFFLFVVFNVFFFFAAVTLRFMLFMRINTRHKPLTLTILLCVLLYRCNLQEKCVSMCLPVWSSGGVQCGLYVSVYQPSAPKKKHILCLFLFASL